MGNDLRVTVVATGLGRAGVERSVQPIAEKPMQIVRPKAAEVDYRNLQRPAVFRNQPAEESVGVMLRDGTTNRDYVDLEVPAFLRRQAD
jgi:cell division protein FtsZ